VNGYTGSGEHFIFEADESDGTFLEYEPRGVLLTSLELDHVDFYHSEEVLKERFCTFLNKLSPSSPFFYYGEDSLMKEVVEEMAKGLTKLEVFLFHNNLYGYVWKPDTKDLLASSYANPNSLIDIKRIIRKRKKVIIYGDAEMSYSEFESDYWPPSGNYERTEKFGMSGEECLRFVKKKAKSAVWINPIFAKEWEDRDDSGTIEAIRNIIPMYDLTVGGVEDAIKDLMKKK